MLHVRVIKYYYYTVKKYSQRLISLHTKFEVSSFTHYKDMNGAPKFNKCSAAAEMCNRARANGAEKWGLLCPFPWGSWIPI